MTDVQERRDRGTQRVPVSTLVEVCGSAGGSSVFEAESLDVSARGMHLRTAYLPEADAPLVCRFENEGKEIVVEGKVAWRREGARGGEFGVQFTALDSRSVDALSGLCEGPATQQAAPQAHPVGAPGARVRLHIDGLGSPMKARVKTGSERKVQVGSSLEFLKVGRELEIEDLEHGARRAAQIDSVSVLIDPSTQVPQLIVALRYAGIEETTPSPTITEVGTQQRKSRSMRIDGEAVTTDAARPAKVAPPKEKPESEDEDEPELRGRVATLAASAEVQAKRAGETLAHASGALAAWVQGAGQRVWSLRQKPQSVRRSTSPMPTASFEKHKLRPQSGGPVESTAEPRGRARWSRRNLAIAGAGGAVAVTALVLAFSGPSAPPPGATSATASDAPVNAVVAGASVPAVLTPAPGGVVTAHVPLFGPTPLTTTEPAPLGPAPDSEAGRELAAAKQSSPRVADESWPEEEKNAAASPSGTQSTPAEAARSVVKPEDVTPWGRGRMHEPTIYRLRLDGPAGALEGAVEPTGFTVTLPDRKVMEPAAAIAKRDERIARVRASNGNGGAQVSFRFKDGVPAYRVRLRRDYVEILISAPEKAAKSTAAKKSSGSDSPR